MRCAVPFANGSNLLVSIIETSVILSVIMTIVLIVVLIYVRARNAVSRERQRVLTTRWREIFKAPYVNEAVPAKLPAVHEADWFTVLRLFVQFHDIRDKDRPRSQEIFPILDDIAYRIGLDEYALMLLEKGDEADRVLALNALGHLHDPRAIDRAVALSGEEGPELSRTAAQCALRVHPRYVQGVLILVGERDDWVRSRVEAMLKEVDPALLDPAMEKAADRALEAGKRHLLDYVRFCTPAAARKICKKILEQAQDGETIAAALRSLAPLSDESDRPLALEFCRHESPIVLLSALRVLRKCVRYEDRELLESLTSHRDYWVRLRAAEAVVQLYGESGLTSEFLAGQTDRYARDAVKQAVAESKLWALRRKKAADRRGAFAPVAQKT